MPCCLWSLVFALHPLHFAFHPAPCALYPVLCALCSMPFTLCSVSCVLCPSSCAVCPVPFTLCSALLCAPYDNEEVNKPHNTMIQCRMHTPKTPPVSNNEHPEDYHIKQYLRDNQVSRTRNTACKTSRLQSLQDNRLCRACNMASMQNLYHVKFTVPSTTIKQAEPGVPYDPTFLCVSGSAATTTTTRQAAAVAVPCPARWEGYFVLSGGFPVAAHAGQSLVL